MAPVVQFTLQLGAIFGNMPLRTTIHSWATEAKNTLLKLYEPKKFIIEKQREFNPKLKNYGNFDFQNLLKDRRYSEVAKEYERAPGILKHPSQINGDSTNLWDHLRYQMWCQHSKWYANHQVVKLKKDFEKENGFVYDFVILGRFDLYFRTAFVFERLLQNKFYASPRNHGNDFRADHDIALMDLWFLSSSEMMDQFSDLYENIYNYCITGPHSSRERVIDCFGEDSLEYLFLDGIDYGALRHAYSPNSIPMFVEDYE